MPVTVAIPRPVFAAADVPNWAGCCFRPAVGATLTPERTFALDAHAPKRELKRQSAVAASDTTVDHVKSAVILASGAVISRRRFFVAHRASSSALAPVGSPSQCGRRG